jgi:hypothetical protein
VAALAPEYRPRRPRATILYAIVRGHLKTFLRHARETYSAPLPRFDVDVLECMKCHGRLRTVGAIDDPLAARALLEQLDLTTDAPAQARARDPSTLDGFRSGRLVLDAAGNLS